MKIESREIVRPLGVIGLHGIIAATSARVRVVNADFNPEVDGLESFAMNDGSVCAWKAGQFRYAAERAG